MLDWEFWMLTHNSPGLAAEDEAAAAAEGEAAAAEDEAAAVAEGEKAGDAEVVAGVGSGWHWELTADAATSTAADGMPCPAPERPQASKPPMARPIPSADARRTRAEVADRVMGTPGRIRSRPEGVFPQRERHLPASPAFRCYPAQEHRAPRSPCSRISPSFSP
jgi:hypothetical protein